MTTTKKVDLFVKETIARIKGDQAEMIAAKNARKADSALNGQIQALKSEIIDREEAVEEAKEQLDNAIYPEKRINDNEEYVRGIGIAQDRLDDANSELDESKKALDFFTNILNTKF